MKKARAVAGPRQSLGRETWRARVRSRLGVALAISVVLHALVLMLELGDPGLSPRRLLSPLPDRRAAADLIVELPRPPPAPVPPAVQPPKQRADPPPRSRKAAKSSREKGFELAAPAATEAPAPRAIQRKPRRPAPARPHPEARPDAPPEILALEEAETPVFTVPAQRAPRAGEAEAGRKPAATRPKEEQGSERAEAPALAEEDADWTVDQAAGHDDDAVPLALEDAAGEQQREEARRKAERERRAQEAARRLALEEARRQAEEARKQEERATAQAEEVARQRALALQQAAEAREREAARRAEDEAARRRAEDERRQQEEARRKEEEAEARRYAREEAERRAAEEARRIAAEAARLEAEKVRAQSESRERERLASQAGADTAAGAAEAAAPPVPGAPSGAEIAAKVLGPLHPPSSPSAVLSRPGSADGSRRRSISGVERDVMLRMYVEGWRAKIERNGQLNYRRVAAQGASEYPLVTVSIRSDGSLEDVHIHRSSGRELDEAVRRIARLHAPYSAFPPPLARLYDVIEIRRVWHFEDTLRIREEIQ